MKNVLLIIAVTSALLFTSCEGEQGPPGPPGTNILGQVFDVNVDFTESNNFEQLIAFPSNVVVYESDVILVYWLEDSIPDSGGSIDVWSQLPQTIYLNEGSFQYTFNYTFLDVLLFLQGDFNLSLLGNGFTNDQVFRIAVVPSEYGTLNLSMTDLLQSLQIDAASIETLD